MAISTQTLRAGGAAPPLVASAARSGRRARLDRWAARLVVGGGVIIIVSILAILFVIGAEVIPLFRAASANLIATQALPIVAGAPARPLPGGLGVDEYREVAYAVTPDALVLVPLRGAGAARILPVPGLDGAAATAVTGAAAGSRAFLGTSDGRVVPLEVKFEVDFKEGRRTVTAAPVFGQASAVDPDRKRAVRRLAAAVPEDGAVTAAQLGVAELVLSTVVERKALIGGTRREETLQALPVPVSGEVTALAIDGRGDDLFVGTSGGEVLRYDLRDRANPALAERATAGTSGASITVLGFLIGDRTLVVGDGRGGVSSWQVVPPPTGGAPRLTRVHEFERHADRVVAFSPSRRDKGFVTADAAGSVHLSYGTSGQTLVREKAGGGVPLAIVLAPKADGMLAVGEQAVVTHWAVSNPHPETTLRTLFGRVWYEGYPKPEYVWQSTGGTDDFEAKLSLTPLIYGTLKGTFYALLFAVPLALLAALYVSEFMHPALKASLKPAVEIMAALPSVVLGFLAGLWLAPLVERVVPGLFVLPVVMTVMILAAYVLWQALPPRVRGAVRPGGEILLLVPIVVLAAWAALALGGVAERWLLGGDYRGWLLSALGLTYDQRNSMVVGLAMGFAVVPIIFTIAEDSLANVPQHLRAGSLALGATRWQTALRVVLPTASPGIFSAIMIGFGRAVGETMIVLMATGNTPVMDWSIFSGFRALSANIAVELPEAPEGGTLFRVLFLAAFLLFCLTFLVNTAAEVVRLKLRRRYRYL
ncbi:MAG: ABC transporter permease subunit [Candidatus Rokuibacteriota bacterium]